MRGNNMLRLKRCLGLVLLAAFALLQAPAHGQSRYYDNAELDALLAPVALYPDALLSHILTAAVYPDEVREAAAWLRTNSHLRGEEAERAAYSMPWHPSVKALLAFPELLARMDESPRWTEDLGAAYLAQEPQVMQAIQDLRRRAQASGHLQSDGYQSVYQQDQYIAVQPARPHFVYVPYYNPLVVYGPWWRSHHPVLWRPWRPRPAVVVSAHFFSRPAVRHHRPAPPHPRPVRIAPPQPVHIHNHVQQALAAKPIVQGAQVPRYEQRSGPYPQRFGPYRDEPRAASGQPYRQYPQRRGRD